MQYLPLPIAVVRPFATLNIIFDFSTWSTDDDGVDSEDKFYKWLDVLFDIYLESEPWGSQFQLPLSSAILL
jgi:hypothetical protein